MELNIGNVVQGVQRALRAGDFEVRKNGLIEVSGGRAGRFFMGGMFTTRIAMPGEDFGVPLYTHNRVVGTGLNRLLNLLPGHVASAPLYIAPFSENVAIDNDLTAATFDSVCDEIRAYTPGTRLPWTTVPATAGVLTNAAAIAAATLTFTAGGPYNVRGLALLTASAKGATTGDLVVASRLTNDIEGLPAGSRLSLEYSLSAVDESDAE